MLKPSPGLADWSDQALVMTFGGLTLVSSLLSVALYDPLPLLLPIICLGALFVFSVPKFIFYTFFFLLPFSVEVEVGSLGTDLPSEPMMIILVAITGLLFITKNIKNAIGFFSHPITLLLLLHVGWIFLTTLSSTVPIFSLKYLLAKLWYIIPFFFLPLMLFNKEGDFRKLFFGLSFTVFIAVAYVWVRHLPSGFAFETSNKIIRPIFRNHVSYAIMLLAFLPYFWHLIRTSGIKNKIWPYFLCMILLVAINLSYTRAAQLSVFLIIGFYWIVKFRILKLAIGVGLIAVTALVLHLSVGNKYLDYAPNFEKTVTHTNFNDLVGATTKMEDISTVERFYRWVAGGYMVKEKPVLGFGPSSFYTNYSAYTVTSYQTYVSDNPERSGIHNNYLMVAVEQGLPGFLIMLVLAVLPLIYCETVYHRLHNTREKGLVMAAGMCYFGIGVTNLINDLIEVDKIGPFYFMSAAIIVLFDVKSRKDAQGTS